MISKKNKQTYVYINEKKIYKKIPIDIPVEKAFQKYAVNAQYENYVRAFSHKLVG